MLELGTALFQPGGRPNFKRLSEETQLGVRSLFGTYIQACAEADSWMRKMGDMGLVETEIVNWNFGRFDPEKGVYLSRNLEEQLPLVLRLLVRTAELVAGPAVPVDVNVLKISRDGGCVKFYRYADLLSESPSPLEESCKVLFRKRRVIARTYEADSARRVLLDKSGLFHQRIDRVFAGKGHKP